MVHKRVYNSNRIEKSKRTWYNITVKAAGAVVFSLIILTSVMIKKEPMESVMTVAKETDMPQQIIIDAGHGGFDGGAVSSDGTVEKDINLQIASRTADILRIYGYDVVMTREEDVSTESDSSGKIASRKKEDMVNRLSMINKNSDAICVSIHLNKFTTSVANGAQIFYGVKDERSYDLAVSIQESIKNNLQPTNERKVKKGTKSTYLLYNSDVPMVIAECGFISNPDELEQLKKEEYQTKMALCICAGIIDYFSR